MASNPPGKCCFQGFYHEGEPKGQFSSLYEVETYETGSESENVLVLLTDVFGPKLLNVQLIADQLADAGFKVYIPDILFGDYITKLDDPNFDREAWFARHSEEATHILVTDFLTELKKDKNPKKIGVIGYCFGAKYGIKQIADDGLADACAMAHPSFVTMEELAAIKERPLLISAAEEDPIFPHELRRQTEDKLNEIGAFYQINLFGGVSHGFAVRGDLTQPKVRFAQDKTIEDQIFFFKFHFKA